MPFTALIERGMIVPGADLYDAKRRHKALVRADGAIALGGAVGSIHRIGALAQGFEACNGWTFWHVERKGRLTLIDALRAEIRAESAGPVAAVRLSAQIPIPRFSLHGAEASLKHVDSVRRKRAACPQSTTRSAAASRRSPEGNAKLSRRGICPQRDAFIGSATSEFEGSRTR